MTVANLSLRALGVLALAAAAPAALSAQSSELEKLSIHGYLTQGYAEATDLPINGITRTGSADMRVAALLFRYDLTESDQVTVQVRHRRLGTSAVGTLEPNVSVNWAFYGHRFNGLGGLTVKAGMLPAARGIFNEVRSVGTILPFYRASTVLYPEGFETIDGVAVSHRLAARGWSLDLNGYYGGFENLAGPNPALGQATASRTRYEKARGGQVWLTTPIEGVRVGVGGVRFATRPATDTSPTATFSRWYASADATFDRFFVRGEYTNLAAGPNSTGYYGQAGVRVVDQLWLNVQDEISNSSYAGRVTRMTRDAAVGLRYAPIPSLALKLEQHYAKGMGTTFDRYRPTTAGPGRTTYTIASVSTAF